MTHSRDMYFRKSGSCCWWWDIPVTAMPPKMSGRPALRQRPLPRAYNDVKLMHEVVVLVITSAPEYRRAAQEIIKAEDREPYSLFTNTFVMFLNNAPCLGREADDEGYQDLDRFVEKVERLIVTPWRSLLLALSCGQQDDMELEQVQLVVELGFLQLARVQQAPWPER
jgi:hypothetical protein